MGETTSSPSLPWIISMSSLWEPWGHFIAPLPSPPLRFFWRGGGRGLRYTKRYTAIFIGKFEADWGKVLFSKMADNWALTNKRKNAMIFTVHIPFLKMFSWQKVGLFYKVLFLVEKFGQYWRRNGSHVSDNVENVSNATLLCQLMIPESLS